MTSVDLLKCDNWESHKDALVPRDVQTTCIVGANKGILHWMLVRIPAEIEKCTGRIMCNHRP